MRYAERRFGPPLDRWIECAWMADDPAPGGAVQTIVPDGCPELIVQLADAFDEETAGGPSRQPAAVVVGPLGGPWRVRPVGRVRTLGVRFRPGGLAAFTPVPVAELAGRAVAVTDVLGVRARHVAEQAAASRGLDDAAGILERALAPLLAPQRVPASAAAAVSALVASRGRVTVDALAAGLGVSARQVERLFASSVGLAPKRLARIVRLQEVMRRAQARPERWVEVALDCGYADQAHLARDFRELAGDTPERWRRAQGALAAQFTTPARLDAFFA